MALLSFFKKKSPAKSSVGCTDSFNKEMPKVKAHESLFTCYKTIFYDVFSDVSGIDDVDVDAIYDFISGCSNGFLSRDEYYSKVWSDFFNGTAWSWGEYDRLCFYFDSDGKYPDRFLVKREYTNSRYVLNSLKVNELKVLAIDLGIYIHKGMLKKDIIESVDCCSMDIGSNEVYKKASSMCESNFNYLLFQSLLSTIERRANSISLVLRAGSLMDYEVIGGDSYFIDIAKSLNNQKYPPFYPGDLSLMKPIPSW